MGTGGKIWFKEIKRARKRRNEKEREQMQKERKMGG